MKKSFKIIALVIFVAFLVYFNRDLILKEIQTAIQQLQGSTQESGATITLEFPSDRFPETAAHIKEAIEHGESSICTIDRKNAEQNRKESLKGVPTKAGYDRDEWPMAICAEGGKGADIKHIDPSDNRGAGSWVSNQLEKYEDGTKVKVIVK